LGEASAMMRDLYEFAWADYVRRCAELGVKPWRDESVPADEAKRREALKATRERFKLDEDAGASDP
jgi:hypothetical protein